jgi:SAM-dependent methyltransferase
MQKSDEPQPSECEILQELRQHPEILARVKDWTGPELHIQNQLRKEFPDALVRAALSLVELRQKAATKFTRAAEMWFDRQGLEQSTAEPVARYKARRFQGEVWDLCCGIGGDALALAEYARVCAVDINPAACLRTQWNAEVYGVGKNVTTSSQNAELVDCANSLVHIDPDRRRFGPSRSVRVEEYVPGLEFLQQLTERGRGGAIKLSPASNFGGKFQDVEHELISLHGECKEATIWFGELKGEFAWRATALPSGETLSGNPLDHVAPVNPPGAFIFDPDPAIVRAGLVDCLAEKLGIWRLDAEEEYLSGDAVIVSPFVQSFELLAELSNNDKEIRNYFRSSSAGQVEIKCRRIPVDADVVRRKLPLPGRDPLVLMFARLEGRARSLVCRRVGGHAG